MPGVLKVIEMEVFLGHRVIVGVFNVPNTIDLVAGQIRWQIYLQMFAYTFVPPWLQFREI